MKWRKKEMIEARGDTYRQKERLKKAGFRWNPKKRCWQKEGDDPGRYRRMFPGLDIHESTKKTQRGTGYRKYADGRGIAGFYICTYCGRITRHPTVDHIIPVRAVSYGSGCERNRRKLIRYMHTDDVNAPKNLCIACRSCNSRKGAKMGMWIPRAVIGRSTFIQAVRLSIRVALIGAAVTTLLSVR